LFSFISINWRGRPLRTYETTINLIGNTTNRGGLVVRARLDRRRYPTGKKVSAKTLRELKIERDAFHGDLELRHPTAPGTAMTDRLGHSRALTFSFNVTLDGCVDHQEGIADDETHAFFTRLMDEGGA
jgi:hypothetical protein